MKFLLSLIICSQVHVTCMPAYQWPETFNTSYDCMMFGYEESINKMDSSFITYLVSNLLQTHVPSSKESLTTYSNKSKF